MERYITSDKIFFHLERLLKWRMKEEVFPVTVEIHPTNRCNNKCEYCQYEKDDSTLSPGQFSEIVEKLKRIDVKGIILSGGGEPTLNRHTPWFLEILHEKKIHSAVITNLNLFSDNLYESILRCADWVRVSMDTVDRNRYRELRGVNNLDEVLKNIRSIVKMKHALDSSTTIGAQIVVTNRNIADILPVSQMASRLGVDYVQIRPVEVLPKGPLPYSSDEFDRIEEEIRKARELEAPSLTVIRSDKWDLIHPGNGEREHGFSFCHGYPFIGAVTATGDYYICCHKVERKDHRFFCGNLVTDSVESVMKNRARAIKSLDLDDCYLGCRGSNINRKLQGLLARKEHKDFL